MEKIKNKKEKRNRKYTKIYEKKNKKEQNSGDEQEKNYKNVKEENIMCYWGLPIFVML